MAKESNNGKETMKDKHKNICRFLTFVLRHKPQVAHLKLDKSGFADMAKVLIAIEKRFKMKLSDKELSDVIKNNASKFFVIEEGKIKAKFGHTIILSMDVPETYEVVTNVPRMLYGCINKNEMWTISQKGLQSISITSGLCDDSTNLKPTNISTVVVVDSKKSIKENITYYFDKKSKQYFCKYIPATYLKFEIN
jgi:RNA:NAD 2'-phosphotransferase (TPT1/KptA family)